MLKVSVLILAYNHENFIAQAVDSALSQTVDFEYEIIIAEDCSTDRTRTILLEYQKNNPDRIRLLLNQTNLGMHANFAQVFQACQGQYIAMLEGDDYWTSHEKLQKQVNFLEQHPDCALCFHDALVVHQDQNHEPMRYCPPDLEEFPAIDRLFFSNFLPTQSVMYRRGLIAELPAWLPRLKMADWPLYILLVQHGRLGYINEVLSVYRIHAAGTWSSMHYLQQVQSIVQMLETINVYLNYQYDSLIRASIQQLYEQLINSVRYASQQQIQELEQAHQSETEQLQLQLWQGQLELEQWQGQLAQTQSELAQSQSLLAQTQTDLAQSQSLVTQLQTLLTQFQSRV